MRHHHYFAPAASLVLLALVALPSHAQDPLESLAKKATLTRQDKGVLDTEVRQRVDRLTEGGPRLEEARDRILRSIRLAGATKAFREAYAEACAKRLTGVPNNDNQDVALAATLILLELEDPGVVETLVGAFRSEHAGVRYLAVKGVMKLSPLITNDQAACAAVLSGLGRAGALERDRIVARTILEALNSKPAGGPFKCGAAGAAAVNEILAAWVQRPAEIRPEAPLARLLCEAGAAYYGVAGAEEQAKMIGRFYDLLTRATARALDPAAGSDSAASALRLVEVIEGTILGMVNQAKAKPPSRRVADAVKDGAADPQKADSEVRSSLAQLRSVLRGPPWNLP